MSDDFRDIECTCAWTERTDTWAHPESWTYYFEAQEYDPECPEHGGFPLLEGPAPCPKCGGAASWQGDEWSCYGECMGYGILTAPDVRS